MLPNCQAPLHYVNRLKLVESYQSRYVDSAFPNVNGYIED